MSRYIIVQAWERDGEIGISNYGVYDSLEEAENRLEEFFDKINTNGFNINKVSMDKYKYSNETLGITGMMEIQAVVSPSDVVFG